MREKPPCKWISNTGFDGICLNDESPACADFCPVPDCPEICRYSESDENNDG